METRGVRLLKGVYMRKNLLLAFILLFLVLMFIFPIRANAKVQSDEKLISMGEFKITYYCSCDECSDGWGTQTATGNHCEEGRTVAVDPNVIAYGTRIKVGKNVYIAEDCGGGVCGDHLDIYVDYHEVTERLGVQYKKIWLIK